MAQVARVANNFTGAGIMVHAYLMYGFPTQTAQETIDSLETVRQMFELGLIQSGFWHRFAMTAHSPVGLHPAEYSCRVTESPFGGFARNDVQFEALSGVTSNNHFASIISKPLFIIEAESIVIFAPIVQFGCLKACAFVTVASSSSVFRRNGPPEAVSKIFSIGLSYAPVKH